MSIAVSVGGASGIEGIDTSSGGGIHGASTNGSAVYGTSSGFTAIYANATGEGDGGIRNIRRRRRNRLLP